MVDTNGLCVYQKSISLLLNIMFNMDPIFGGTPHEINDNTVECYLSGNPQITFNKTIYRRYTKHEYRLHTYTHKSLPWCHELTGDYIVNTCYIMIPVSVPKEDLKHFTLMIGFTNLEEDGLISRWNLAAAPIIASMVTDNMYHVIQLIDLPKCMPVISTEKNHLCITLESDKYDKLETIIKIYQSYPNENHNFKTSTNEVFTKQIWSYCIDDDKYVLPKDVILIGLVWNTNEDVQSVKLTGPGVDYCMSKYDFQHIEPNRVKIPLLENNWGCMMFGLTDFHNYQLSGHLVGGQHTLVFDKPVTGHIWIIAFNVVRCENGYGKVLDQNGKFLIQ